MKKNNKTYLLLAVVIGIWGFIGFRLLNVVNPGPIKNAQIVSNETYVPKQLKARDTFSLALNYRDPFLGAVIAPKKAKKIVAKKEVKPKAPEKAISYTGFITDKASQQKIFFLTIEGQQHMMALNDVVQGVKLIQGTKNNVKVRLDGNTRTIALKE